MSIFNSCFNHKNAILQKINTATALITQLKGKLLSSYDSMSAASQVYNEACYYLDDCNRTLNECANELNISLGSRNSNSRGQKQLYCEIDSQISDIINQINDISLFYDAIKAQIHPACKELLQSIIQTSSV